MTKMEQDILKKAEFHNLIRTVISTVTIIVSIFIGGAKMKDAIVEDIRQEFKAEITNKLKEFDSKQALKDKDQDFKIEKIELELQNIFDKK